MSAVEKRRFILMSVVVAGAVFVAVMLTAILVRDDDEFDESVRSQNNGSVVTPTISEPESTSTHPYIVQGEDGNDCVRFDAPWHVMLEVPRCKPTTDEEIRLLWLEIRDLRETQESLCRDIQRLQSAGGVPFHSQRYC